MIYNGLFTGAIIFILAISACSVIKCSMDRPCFLCRWIHRKRTK